MKPTAIYSDSHDEAENIYAAVLAGTRSLLIKLDKNEQTQTDWSFELSQEDTSEGSTVINFIFPDPEDPAIWVGGLVDGKGAIFKMKKQSGSLHGMRKFSLLDELDGHSASSE